MSETPSTYVRPKDIDNRASFGQRVQWRLETIAWDVIYWWPMKLLGPDKASDFGGWVMKKIGPRLSQHKTTRRNLKLAFPGWSDAEIDRTALAAWESAGRTAGSMPSMSAARARCSYPATSRIGKSCLRPSASASRMP